MERKKTPQDEHGQPKSSNSSETKQTGTTLTSTANSTSTPITGTTALPSTNRDRHSRRFTTAIAVLVAIILSFVFRSAFQSKDHPTSYALCSKEGFIYTVDKEKPQVECLVVHKKRIVDTGSIDYVRQRWGDRDRTGPVAGIPLPGVKNGLKVFYTEPGQIIVPGLADAHAHVLENGFKKQLELDGSASVDEVVSRVKNFVLSHPDVLNDTSIWIQGMGWDQTKWHGSKFPTADVFEKDPVLRNRPIALRRVDGHALFVSKRVLQIVGELPHAIEGGEIIRNSRGEATGVFVDNAMSLVPIPPLSEKERLEYFGITITEALSHGLTSIHDADTSPENIAFFKRMADRNALPLRLYLMGNIDEEEYWGDRIEKLYNYGPAGRLNLRSVKLFADGALGSWGAALLNPYSDKQETQGLLLKSPQVLSDLINRFIDDEFQVNIHCIGDRANKLILDILEDALDGKNATELRPRIEHAQILTAEDIRRAGRLGVISSVQPTHATSDMWYAEQRLGPKRIKTAYAYRSQLEMSDQHVLPLGSDFPIEGVNPLLGFYAAVSRLAVDGTSPHGAGGWFPKQRLTRAQALKGMTYDAAYASFNEDNLGTLTPGKLADFVVLDTNIMTVPVSKILDTKVIATVIDGKPMYGKLL